MKYQKSLILFFMINLFCMVGVSIWATESQNVVLGIDYLVSNRWGIATLFDTYFSFIIIYLWMAYKEKNGWMRLTWFVLVCTLGTIAVSIYILLEIRKASRTPKKLERGFLESFLLRQESL